MKEVPKLQTNYITPEALNEMCKRATVANITTSDFHSSGTFVVKNTEPHAFNYLAFTLIALVVLYYTHRFVYRSGFKAGKYQEQIDRYNNGA